MDPIKSIKRLIALSVLFLVGPILAGCATLANGTKQSVPIRSEPTNATLVIKQNGRVVTDSQTPYMARLNRGSGFFQGGDYKIKLSMPGYRPETVRVQGRLSSWYFLGNLVSWNIIGYLIVDPASGGMWYLTPDSIRARLPEKQATRLDRKFEKNRGILVVLDQKTLDDLRPALRSSARVPGTDPSPGGP